MSNPFFNPKHTTETTNRAAFPRTHLLSKPFPSKCIKFLLKMCLLIDQESYTLSYSSLPPAGGREELSRHQKQHNKEGKENLSSWPCLHCPISNQVCEQLGHLQFMPAMCSDPRSCPVPSAMFLQQYSFIMCPA